MSATLKSTLKSDTAKDGMYWADSSPEKQF